MTVHPHAARPQSHLVGCTGFWLWALVGAVAAFGFISFLGAFVLVPVALAAYWLERGSRWNAGPVHLGLLSGAGVPLLLVAGLQWNAWHHRVAGDNTPNPFYWGGLGLCFLVAGIVAYGVRSRRQT